MRGLLIFFTFVLSACSGGSHPTGTWIYTEDFTQTFELFDDGLARLPEGLSGSWTKLDDGRIRLSAEVYGSELVHMVDVLGDDVLVIEKNKNGVVRGEFLRAKEKWQGLFPLLAKALSAKESDACMRYAQEALEKDDTFGRSYRVAAICASRAGDHLRSTEYTVASFDKDTNRHDAAQASLFNSYAWSKATSDDSRVRDGKDALIYAKKAVALRSDCATLDTTAAAYAASGQMSEAITTQERAFEETNQQCSLGDGAKARLARYKNGKEAYTRSVYAKSENLANPKKLVAGRWGLPTFLATKKWCVFHEDGTFESHYCLLGYHKKGAWHLEGTTLVLTPTHSFSRKTWEKTSATAHRFNITEIYPEHMIVQKDRYNIFRFTRVEP